MRGGEGEAGNGRGWQPRKRKLEESIKTRREEKGKEGKKKKGRRAGGARWFVGGSDKKFIRRSVGADGVAIMEKNGEGGGEGFGR